MGEVGKTLLEELTDDERKALLETGLFEIEKLEKYSADDLGRSRRFSSKYTDDVRWCQDMKCWLIWNGKVWEKDRTLKVVTMAKSVVDDIIRDAGEDIANAKTETEIDAAQKNYRLVCKAKTEKAIRSMLELAKSDLPITANELDADPFLLNCENGVVDLRDGKLKLHDHKYYMTKITNTSFYPTKKMTKFMEFLKDITLDDEEMVEYFQMVLGMAAIGKVFHEGLAIFYGAGQNGKSTFLNCISKVLGQYAGSLNPEILMLQRNGQQPAGLADINGRRFVTAIETEEGKRISSAMLKQLASTDPITARRLYENPITFNPTHTLIMATNFLPKISSTDTGTWRRIAIVPFKASFAGKKQIKDYASVLFEEDRNAILTWIIEGAKKYIQNDYHMKTPKAVEEATKEYKSSEDWLGNFINEMCETGNQFSVKSSELYEKYTHWCEKNGEYKRRTRDFAVALELQGFEKKKTAKGMVWFGIRVMENFQFSEVEEKSEGWWNTLPVK